MKECGAVASVIVMALAVIVGFLRVAALGGAREGAILFAMIAGFGCVIYAPDNRGS